MESQLFGSEETSPTVIGEGHGGKIKVQFPRRKVERIRLRGKELALKSVGK